MKKQIYLTVTDHMYIRTALLDRFEYCQDRLRDSGMTKLWADLIHKLGDFEIQESEKRMIKKRRKK